MDTTNACSDVIVSDSVYVSGQENFVSVTAVVLSDLRALVLYGRT